MRPWAIPGSLFHRHGHHPSISPSLLHTHTHSHSHTHTHTHTLTHKLTLTHTLSDTHTHTSTTHFLSLSHKHTHLNQLEWRRRRGRVDDEEEPPPPSLSHHLRSQPWQQYSNTDTNLPPHIHEKRERGCLPRPVAQPLHFCNQVRHVNPFATGLKWSLCTFSSMPTRIRTNMLLTDENVRTLSFRPLN